MKKFLILILLFSGYVTAETYKAKLSNKDKNAYLIPETNDELGFNLNTGIHKDTGTIYNPDGFDQEGYNSSGLSRKNCRYSAPTLDSTNPYGRVPRSNADSHYFYRLNGYWGLFYEGAYMGRRDTITYPDPNIVYSIGDVELSGSFGSNSNPAYAQVCEQTRKS